MGDGLAQAKYIAIRFVCIRALAQAGQVFGATLGGMALEVCLKGRAKRPHPAR